MIFYKRNNDREGLQKLYNQNKPTMKQVKENLKAIGVISHIVKMNKPKISVIKG